MLAILTDAHISPSLAEQVAAKRPEIAICSLRNWRGGEFLNAEDDTILAAAAEDGLTLLTYDQRTIVPLVAQWGAESRDHGGVIFIDERSIAQNDIGGQLRAVIALWDAGRSQSWQNAVGYLKAAS
jgi:hypothetical protein